MIVTILMIVLSWVAACLSYTIIINNKLKLDNKDWKQIDENNKKMFRNYETILKLNEEKIKCQKREIEELRRTIHEQSRSEILSK